MAGIKKYKHDDKGSYTLGLAPTIDLLLCKPELADKIFTHSNIEKNENTGRLYQLCAKHNVPIEENDKVFNILSQKGNCFVIGMFQKFQTVLSETSHILLVSPSDAGNVGNIIRTAVGFGIKNIGIIKPAVDVFDPKAIRASMGALFYINFEYFENMDAYRKKYPNHNLYAFTIDAQTSLSAVKFDEPYSLIFGNEATGLPSEYSNFCKTVTIPYSKKIDSLNLASAISIAAYIATIATEN